MAGGLRIGCMLGLLVALAAAPAAAARAPEGQLGHAGRWLTDDQGRVVVLHGVNMVYKRPPYHPAHAGFGADDARFLKREGFNTVRLGVIYKAVEPQPGSYDEAYLDRIAASVRTLAAEGIHVQLDFHQDLYNERFQGEGFPDWAVQDDGLPAEPKVGFPGNYAVMPALWRAYDHFWANDPGPGGVGLQDRYAAAWRRVAERFRDSPYLMGYDLFNEPWPGSVWPTCANPGGCPAFDAQLTAFSRRAIEAIRRADRRNLVWYEPHVLFNNGADTNHGDTGDAAAGMSFHDYCLIAGTVPGASLPDPPKGEACGAFDSVVFGNAEKQSQETGDTLLLSEFGATDDLTEIERIVEASDRHRVSWQYWHYCECDDPTTSGTGGIQSLVPDASKPPGPGNLKVDKLLVLARPYPQAVAGTPLDWDFDPDSKRFEASWSTERAGGGGRFGPGAETRIWVGRRHYPAGYRVEVRGARVTSTADAPLLRVRTARGASAAAVTVTPR